MVEYHMLGRGACGKQQKQIFSQFWRLQIQGQGTSRLVSGEALPDLQALPFCYVFTWPFLWAWGESSLVSLPPFIRIPVLLDLAPTVMTSFNLNYLLIWASQVSQTVKNLPAMPESQDKFLDPDDPLDKGIVTQSSILAWRIPWTEEWATVHGVSKSQTQLSDCHTPPCTPSPSTVTLRVRASTYKF